MDVGTNLDQQGVAGANEPLARREREEVTRAADTAPTGRAHLLAIVRPGPEDRGDALKYIRRRERPRQSDSARRQLLVIRDRDDHPIVLTGRRGTVVFIDRND